MEYKGIDVSKWQGLIDWVKVKSNGIQFVIIRSSCGTTYLDPQLQTNVKGCETNNIPYGFYHYLYAKTVADAEKEAEYFLKVISYFSPSYPIYLDIEDESLKGLGKTLLTDMAVAFCSKLEKAGYFTGIYASKDWFVNKLDYARLARFDGWLAQWGASPDWTGTFGLWQNSSKGLVSGITGNVDTDISYKDYPAIIRKLGLNNLKAVQAPKPVAPRQFYKLETLHIGSKGEAETISNIIKNMGYTDTNFKEEN